MGTRTTGWTRKLFNDLYNDLYSTCIYVYTRMGMWPVLWEGINPAVHLAKMEFILDYSLLCMYVHVCLCPRSPMCRLIASEELWLLLDALQEPVPEEVHQHLENINTSTTPLVVSVLFHLTVQLLWSVSSST